MSIPVHAIYLAGDATLPLYIKSMRLIYTGCWTLGGGRTILYHFVAVIIAYHYKNRLVVLTTEWVTMAADKLKRQWL